MANEMIKAALLGPERVARESHLSGAGIAGTTVGAFGGFLILICIFAPIIRRSIRRRRRNEARQAEMGPVSQQIHGRHKLDLPHLFTFFSKAVRRRRSKDFWISPGAQLPSIQSQPTNQKTLGDTQAHGENGQDFIEPVDTEAPGEAWSYYHPDASEGPTLAVPRPKAVPPSQPMGPTAPMSPVSPMLGKKRGPDGPRGFVEEPDTLSPSTVNTVSPKDSTGTLLKTPLSCPASTTDSRRQDNLPMKGIISDIPSPPQHAVEGPSGNPMDLMKPTTDIETKWSVEQEIYKLENSSSPMATLPSPSPAPQPWPNTVENGGLDPICITCDPSPDPDHWQPPVQAPSAPAPDEPPACVAIGIQDVDMDISASAAATPPPSVGPSLPDTPDTRRSNSYTPSPPPRRPKFNPSASSNENGSSSIGTAPTTGTSASPRTFICEQCNRQFDQIHKLNHHRRYHERPHACPHEACNMRFGTKTHLDRHVNDKHKKTRKYFCMMHDCPYSRQGGKSFPRKDNWRRHMRNKHHVTAETEPGQEYVDEEMDRV